MTTAQTRAQTITTTTGGTFNLPNNTVVGTPTLFDGHTATQNENVFAGTGPFTIKFGTGHYNTVTFSGGNSGASSVTGLAGNDTVTLTGGAHGTYALNLGNGDNTIALDNAFGTVTYTTSNTGAYDTIDASQITTSIAANLSATTGAFATTNGAIADLHTIHNLILGSGAATVTLNNLEDQLTFGTGSATITAGTGNDTFVAHDFTGAASATQAITAGLTGNNTLDFRATTANVAVNYSSGGDGTAYVTGIGTGLGFEETINFSGAAHNVGITNILGGTGTDTFTFGNSAGNLSLNGVLGTGNTLVYTGNQGVTMDVRDHDLTNAALTTNVTFHGINTYKVLGTGNNTIIGDGNGETYYLGNGTNNIDTSGGGGTIHNDMGGHTTVALGNTYGALVVTNVNPNGALTIDASALTHALTVCNLGTGITGPTVGINDGNGTTVAWDQHSTVTGLIGNDLATTVHTTAGSADLNYNISLGNGVDSVTLGNGNSSVSVGSGAGDSITVGTGNNTLILGAGAGDTVTAGSGNNYIYLGGGSGTEAIGIGSNTVDFSNGGTHVLTETVSSTGTNTFQGFSQNNNWNVTINATSGLDQLNLTNYSQSQITFTDTPLVGGNVENLVLTVDANHVVTINNYFDHSAATAAGAAAGTGVVHDILLAGNVDLTYANVAALATHTGFV